MFKLTANELSMVLREMKQAKTISELDLVHDEACIMCITHGNVGSECNDCCPIAKAYKRRKEQIENPPKTKWVIAWTNPEG